MNIDGAALLAQYHRAQTAWPFLRSVEHGFGLPPLLLFAVGSRETNLTNETGDGGHGHGVWQLDDRSHRIPTGFAGNVTLQADTAAKMLAGLLREFADVAGARYRLRCALAAYNAGTGTVRFNLAHGLSVDTGTAHNDYAGDVLDRLDYLTAHTGGAPVTARPLTTDDIPAIAKAVTRELLAEQAASVDGKAHGTVSHCLAGTFELATAIAGKIGAKP